MACSYANIFWFNYPFWRYYQDIKSLNTNKQILLSRIFLTFNYQERWLNISSKCIPDNTRIITRIAAFNAFNREQWVVIRIIYFIANFWIIIKYLTIFGPLKKQRLIARKYWTKQSEKCSFRLSITTLELNQFWWFWNFYQ